MTADSDFPTTDFPTTDFMSITALAQQLNRDTNNTERAILREESRRLRDLHAALQAGAVVPIAYSAFLRRMAIAFGSLERDVENAGAAGALLGQVARLLRSGQRVPAQCVNNLRVVVECLEEVRPLIVSLLEARLMADSD
jgi:hypothetical protein